MSARFDCRFNFAIMVKILRSNAAGCPEFIIVAASDLCFKFLLGF